MSPRPREGRGVDDKRPAMLSVARRPIKLEALSMVFCELSVYSIHVGVNC